MAKKKIVEPFRTTDEAFRSLLRVFGLIRRVMEPYFAAFGISGSQWAVLIVLYRAKTESLSGLWLKDIGERLLVRPPSVTGVVDRLQRLGLVARKPSSTDSRAKQVSLTPAGCKLVERILEGHRAKVSDIFGGLTPDEQGQLHQLLDQMGEHLKKTMQYEATSNVY
jgi:MarR family transcriptional regulator, 2-MHQ and catechol-resistance regulon repressor